MSKGNIAARVQQALPVVDEAAALRAKIAALEAALAAKDAEADRPLRFKVSGKGAVSVYGMGRFPVTLYKTQWRKLLGVAKDLEAFIKANEARLSDKSKPSEESASSEGEHGF